MVIALVLLKLKNFSPLRNYKRNFPVLHLKQVRNALKIEHLKELVMMIYKQTYLFSINSFLLSDNDKINYFIYLYIIYNAK